MKNTNTLSTVYEHINDMTLSFRTVVEVECNWSTPTFYRRIRLPHLCSPAEEKMALKVAQTQARALLALIDEQTLKVDQEMPSYPSHLQDKLNTQSTLNDADSPYNA
ncbi:hypothetical protein SAMN04488128_101229 [Chitinophaga eiseniae]|uniref:Uncharacterized protein n=1 Tax=Chitinophaga eiseniae TaxID=634771 RepID=A0A1T4KNW3_9BACT|nr:hypothetical protein [Chitinophaga eiseniae]SJZ44074.1 hypothetical protein SAMN04488128_101229 [Chitinophaga eiseniae]